MILYAILYHDPYSHEQCPPECCSATTTIIECVCLTKELAQQYIDSKSNKYVNHKDNYEIAAVELIQGTGVLELL